MNTFGRLFRTSIFGESHGQCIGVLIDGCPAGIELCEKDFVFDLERRKSKGIGTTQRKESDRVVLKTGIFKGKTTGTPILILIENRDIDSADYERIKDFPRPGHGDFVVNKKFKGLNDYRGGGHFSGRLTAGLVAAGIVAKKIITPIKINAKVIEVGGQKNIEDAINSAIKRNSSIGGIVECEAENVPIGLGEPFFDSIESLIAHAVFSIPGIKGIEFGIGFKCTRIYGEEYNDEILDAKGTTRTNNSGGINAGISNGNKLVFRLAVRPAASISKIQKTINIKTGEKVEISVKGRHDACIALRVPVIVECATALVLADLMLIESKAMENSKDKVVKWTKIT